MKKVILVIALLVLVSIVSVYAAGEGEASGEEKVVTLKVGGIQPIGDPSTKALYKMAEIAEAKSNGTLILQIFPASQLGNATSEIEAVGMGAQDMFVDAGWMGTFLPDKQIDSMFFNFVSKEHYANYINSDVNKQMEDEFAELKGIKVIASNWFRAPRSFVTKKPFTKASDLAGLKVRVPDLKGYLESVAALGANPTQVAWGEVYLALKQGVVDAAEGPKDSLYSMKFYEAAKYVTITDHNRDSMQVMINDKIFKNKLSANQQQILVEAALEAGDWYSAQIDGIVENALNEMKANGAVITELAPAELQKLRGMVWTRTKEIDASGDVWRTGLFDEIQKLIP